MAKGIYVEVPIRCSIDELWEKTQNPELHQRWDLRFTNIEYLPRGSDEPQRFLYRTRIGFGLKIDGQGESTGTRDSEGGGRTSSLKFWSNDPKSLIRTGSGYWKYLPEQSLTGMDKDCPYVRFITWYDYETRFGGFGKLLDRLLFRPLLGWATAWSFDRLRQWIEEGVPPEASRDRTLTYALARGTAAFISFYHGLVPKLLYHNDIELDLLSRIGITPQKSSRRRHPLRCNRGGFCILVIGSLAATLALVADGRAHVDRDSGRRGHGSGIPERRL